MGSGTLLAIFFLGLLSLVAASDPGLQKRSFTVARVKNPSFTGRNGPRELAKAYRKYKIAIPRGLADHLAAQDVARRKRAVVSPRPLQPVHSTHSRRASYSAGGSIRTIAGRIGLAGSVGGRVGLAGTTGDAAPLVARQQGNGINQIGNVTATPEQGDTEYLSPVTIGGQRLNLDFDTGSSDLWVFSAPQTAGGNLVHNAFITSQSKSFRPMQGATFQISYGDGSGATGGVGLDTVAVGNASVNGQPVQLAERVSQSFIDDKSNDGLMGLAFSKLNTVKPQPQKTFFDNIKSSLAEPLFTADLKKNATGAYTFGFVDTTKFKGQMTWIPVNSSSGFWQFRSEKFSINGEPPQAATAGGQAIADTGTTLILADSKIVTGYYSRVQGATMNQTVGGVIFPCNTQLPNLALDIGGLYMADVSGTDINFAPLGDGNCFGGVQAVPTGFSGPSIYGDIFFKSQFVAFNGGNNTLGMAPHA